MNEDNQTQITESPHKEKINQNPIKFLEENDIIKIEVSSSLKDIKSEKTSTSFYLNMTLKNQSMLNDNEDLCRLCHQPGKVDDKLINPCNCTNQYQYFHQKCAKKWFSKKFETYQKKTILRNFIFHTIEITNSHTNIEIPRCEICNAEIYCRFYFKLKKESKCRKCNTVMSNIGLIFIFLIILLVIDFFPIMISPWYVILIVLCFNLPCLALLIFLIIDENKYRKFEFYEKNLNYWEVLDNSEVSKFIDRNKDQSKKDYFKNMGYRNKWFLYMIKDKAQIVNL